MPSSIFLNVEKWSTTFAGYSVKRDFHYDPNFLSDYLGSGGQMNQILEKIIIEINLITHTYPWLSHQILEKRIIDYFEVFGHTDSWKPTNHIRLCFSRHSIDSVHVSICVHCAYTRLYSLFQTIEKYIVYKSWCSRSCNYIVEMIKFWLRNNLFQKYMGISP